MWGSKREKEESESFVRGHILGIQYGRALPDLDKEGVSSHPAPAGPGLVRLHRAAYQRHRGDGGEGV